MTASPRPGRSGGLRLAAFFSFALLAASAGLPGCRKRPDVRIVGEGNPSGAAPAAPGAPAIPREIALSAAETAAIRTFLASHAGWRVAADADARPSEDADDMTPLYGVYHPYFVRGDLDDDGRLDFVLAFVDRGKPASSPWFSVVAFFGDGRGGFRPPQVIESEISLERGDLSIDRDAVVITPDLAEDDTSRRYRWNARQRRFEFVSGDDAEPDHVPATRV